jgi:hypothetical protein
MVRRRLLNLLTLLSLLLCVAVVALWVRGYCRADSMLVWAPVRPISTASGRAPGVSALNYRGSAWLWSHRSLSIAGERGHFLLNSTPPRHFDKLDMELAPVFDARWSAVLFDVAGFAAAERDGRWAIRLPDYAGAAITGVLPALCAWRHARRRHRESNGLCRSCGYDLRATPDTCPECGAEKPAIISN